MKVVWKAILGMAAGLLLLLLAVWGVARGRAEQAKEREREAPVKVPPRLEALPEGGVVVKLEPEAQAALGLATTEVREGTVQPGLTVSGLILDPLPFAELLGKLRSARAETQAAKASVEAAQAAWERTRTLNQEEKGASDKALQEAQSRLRLEEAKAAVAAAEAERLEASWRQQGLPPDLASYLAFQRALVRLELPLGQTPPAHPGNVSVRLAEEGASRPVHVFGTASAAAPGTGGVALLGALEALGLRPGQPVEGFLPMGAPAKGLVPPGSSLVRAEGRVWVYVVRPDGRFERRALKLMQPVGNSYAVEGLRPGERLVSRGAQALLAEEYRSQIRVGEDSK